MKHNATAMCQCAADDHVALRRGELTTVRCASQRCVLRRSGSSLRRHACDLVSFQRVAVVGRRVRAAGARRHAGAHQRRPAVRGRAWTPAADGGGQPVAAGSCRRRARRRRTPGRPTRALRDWLVFLGERGLGAFEQRDRLRSGCRCTRSTGCRVRCRCGWRKQLGPAHDGAGALLRLGGRRGSCPLVHE